MRTDNKIKARTLTPFEEAMIEGKEIGQREGLRNSLQKSVEAGLMDQNLANGFFEGFVAGRIRGMVDCMIFAVELKFGGVDESLKTQLKSLKDEYEIQRVQLMLDWHSTLKDFYSQFVDFLSSERARWYTDDPDDLESERSEASDTSN